MHPSRQKRESITTQRHKYEQRTLYCHSPVNIYVWLFWQQSYLIQHYISVLKFYMFHCFCKVLWSNVKIKLSIVLFTPVPFVIITNVETEHFVAIVNFNVSFKVNFLVWVNILLISKALRVAFHESHILGTKAANHVFS